MLKQLARAGHTIVDVELPMSSHALAAYYVIMPAEVSTNLARLDGIRYGHAVRGKTLLEDYILSRTGLRRGDAPPHSARHIRTLFGLH